MNQYNIEVIFEDGSSHFVGVVHSCVDKAKSILSDYYELCGKFVSGFGSVLILNNDGEDDDI